MPETWVMTSTPLPPGEARPVAIPDHDRAGGYLRGLDLTLLFLQCFVYYHGLCAGAGKYRSGSDHFRKNSRSVSFCPDEGNGVLGNNG